MLSRVILRGVPVAAAGIVLSPSTISNEPKRRFYEDESSVVPVPGTVTPAAGTEVEALGPTKLVDGTSVRTSQSLESFFASSRSALSRWYTGAQAYINDGYTKYYETERRVTSTVSDLHHKQEDLLPNGIYVVIAALSGNILARQRGIVAKAVYPVALGLASFKYFLPQTFANTTGFAWTLEKRFIPQVADTQEQSLKKADELLHKLEATSASSQQKVQSSVQSLRQKIADVTGLNLDGEVSKK